MGDDFLDSFIELPSLYCPNCGKKVMDSVFGKFSQRCHSCNVSLTAEVDNGGIHVVARKKYAKPA